LDQVTLRWEYIDILTPTNVATARAKAVTVSLICARASFVGDGAKPREGKSVRDVARRFEELRRDGFRGFQPVTDSTSFIKEALEYYDERNFTDKTERLRDLVRQGSLRAGEDEELIFYGCNDDVIYLIATNKNPHLTATLIHELNEGTHDENDLAELAYFEYAARRTPLLNTLIDKNEEEFAKEPQLRSHHGLPHSLRIWAGVEGWIDRFSADREVFAVIAFLHDIGVIYTDRSEHGAVSAEHAERVLREVGFSGKKSRKALSAIKKHDDYKAVRKDIESQLLFYAECKEAFGPKGASRYLHIYRERGVPENEIGSRVLANVEQRFSSVSDQELKASLRPVYEFSRRYFAKLAADQRGKGRSDLVKSLSGVKGVDKKKLVSILEQELLTLGLVPYDVTLEVTSPSSTSRRILHGINLIPREGNGEPIFSYYVKRPNNETELKRALYASRTDLGPAVIYADPRVIVEERLNELRDVRHIGMSLTDEEAKILGRKLARAFNRMISDDVACYRSNIPATHIIVCGLGTNLEPKFIDWSNSAELGNARRVTKRAAMKEFIKRSAYLLRQELSSAGAVYGWSSFVQTLADPGWVTDRGLRADYEELVSDVEETLSRPDAHRGETVVSERWKKFFQFSRSVSILTEFDRQQLHRMLLLDTRTPLVQARNSLILKLEGAGIKDPRCGLAVIDDIIEHVGIEKYFGIGKKELQVILGATFAERNVEEKTAHNIISDTINALRDTGSRLIVSSLVRDVLSDVLYAQDYYVPCEISQFQEIINEIFLKLQEIELRKIDFEVTRGVVGMNRPWAEHLLVKEPEPERRIVITYNVKSAHTSFPSVEVERSEIASELLLGPRFVYGDYEQGVIVEKWLTDGDIGDRSPTLTHEEATLVCQRLAQKIYQMFDLRRERRVTHKFDNLPHHIFLVGQGRDIDVLFIDWGKDCYVDESNREDVLQGHLGSISEQIRQHLGPEGMAYFVAELREIAAKASPEELECYDRVWYDARRAMAAGGFLKDRVKNFFEEVERCLKDMETGESKGKEQEKISRGDVY